MTGMLDTELPSYVPIDHARALFAGAAQIAQNTGDPCGFTRIPAGLCARGHCGYAVSANNLTARSAPDAWVCADGACFVTISMALAQPGTLGRLRDGAVVDSGCQRRAEGRS
jgi:hypothetical protein